MIVLLVSAGLLLSSAVIVREILLVRERAVRDRQQQDLRNNLERHEALLRRSIEDLYVLRTVLAERNLVDESDLVRSRVRLIEQPRRAAQERESVVRDFGVTPVQVTPDDGEPKIH